MVSTRTRSPCVARIVPIPGASARTSPPVTEMTSGVSDSQATARLTSPRPGTVALYRSSSPGNRTPRLPCVWSWEPVIVGEGDDTTTGAGVLGADPPPHVADARPRPSAHFPYFIAPESYAAPPP